MANLYDVAERWRIVSNTWQRFLAMHAVQSEIVEPALDRVAADLEITPPDPEPEDASRCGAD